MPAAPPRQRFAARFDRLPDLLAAAGAACDAVGMGAAARHRVELVLEEAFSNTIRHGYRRESDEPAWLATSILTDGLRLVYQDAAPPFDPLHGASLPPQTGAGGLGRMLIKTLPRSAAYAREGGLNTLTLEFGPRE